MKRFFALFLALLIASSLYGCGGTDSYEYPAVAPVDVDFGGNFGLATADSNGKYDEAYEVDYDAYAPAYTPSGALANPDDKLIYRADVTVSTTRFDESIAQLNGLAAEMGGFIESSNISNGSDWYYESSTRASNRTANYVLRVPASRFSETVSRAGTLGVVQSSSTGVDNITPQFVDQTARKHSLEVQEQRLLELLSRAEDVTATIELEDRLADVRYQIESIESTLRSWQQQVDYSTVYVYLREVEAYSPEVTGDQSFGHELGEALGDGWAGFVGFLRALVIFLARILPLIVIFAVVAIVAIVAVSVSRKKKRRAAQAQQQPATPTAPPTDGQNM